MSHLSEDEVERFLAARLGLAEQKKVARHLLAGCGVCSRKLVEQAPERLLEQAAGQYRKTAQGSPHQRVLAAALEQDARWRLDEKKLARSLELLRGSPGVYDGLTFRQVRGLHGPPLVEALMQRSFELRFRAPRAMRWLAYNAVHTAESLRAEEHGQSFVFDLRSRAWSELANAYRINHEFAEAEGAIGQTRILLRQGSGDLRILARAASHEAALRNAQRRLVEARELRDGVYRIYLKMGDQHLAGRALIAKSIGTEYDGRARQGVQFLRKGLALLDPADDPQLVAIGRQCLINNLASSGEYSEASELLLKSGLRQYFAEDPLILLKIRWLEGRVLAGIGKTSRAESALIQTQNEFLDLERPYDAALVGLDMLPLLQGKQQKIIAKAAYVTFRNLGIRREAAKARPYLQ
jgi:hypothetical protein